MTTQQTPREAALQAVAYHAAREARGDRYMSCRLYDGEDNGRPGQRCWLVPGHQCDCMNEHRARWEARQPDEPACLTNYPNVEITLTDCDGRALDLDGVTWPVVVSAGSASAVRDALERFNVSTGYAVQPIRIVEVAISESSMDDWYLDNLMDIHGTRWSDLSERFEAQRKYAEKQALNPARYTYPEAKRKKRW